MRSYVLFSPVSCRFFRQLKAIGGFFFAAAIIVLISQNAIAQALQPGEAFVTRFSGISQSGGVSVIDISGTTGSIITIGNPGQPPRGEHWLNETLCLPKGTEMERPLLCHDETGIQTSARLHGRPHHEPPRRLRLSGQSDVDRPWMHQEDGNQ